MSQGYTALTEKEKETLRLLLDGHDAKSLARHLDLSVHTINERLREARRKLAVSSSRAAARLLREEEERLPKSLGDKSLGAVPGSGVVEQPRSPAGPGGVFRRYDRVIGGLLVSIAVSLAIVVASSLGGGVQTSDPQAAAPASTPAEAAVTEAARHWLALVDASDWQASRDATGQSFRKANTVGRWTEASKSVRVPLGAMKSRKLITANVTPAPPNGYWTVRFRTEFADKADVVETVALVHEGGTWKVAGYPID